MALTWDLVIHETLPGEIAHHYEPARRTALYSRANRFFGTIDGAAFSFSVPIDFKGMLKTRTRLMRRLTRSDKSNALFNRARDGIVVIYSGGIWFHDLTTGALTRVADLVQCRNILHQAVAVNAQGMFFGEYGSNPAREPVPVWGSGDGGRSWEVVYRFPAGRIRHVHGIYTDPHSDSLWIPTGDFAGECYVFEVPQADFLRIRAHGNGQQQWRPVSMFFEQDRLIWAMDSQLETSYLQIFPRDGAELRQGQAFPGPVWYAKSLSDGVHVLQSTVEIGPGSQSEWAHIFAARDLEDWAVAGRFRKDIWPKRYFKFGVIGFADGAQASDDFVIFGEALKGLDGRILRVGLQGGAV